MLDGPDAIAHGPGVPSTVTMAVRIVGSGELHTVRKVEGRVVNVGSLKLGQNGRTLVLTFWRPERPDKRAVLFYEKQQTYRFVHHGSGGL